MTNPPARGVLADVRVLDFTRLLPGAVCTLMLADMGADVVKIEQPETGDYNRAFDPINRYESGSFLLLNRSKRSVSIDLKDPRGLEIARAMAAQADVVIEGFRPGVMERLGLGYESLRSDNAGLVYCSITGYGQDGPMRDVVGHDINYLALVGALPLFGGTNGPGGVPGLSIADIGGGSLMACIGVLAALFARTSSGEGQFIDCAMTDNLMPWLSYPAAETLFGDRDPHAGGQRFLGQCVAYNVHTCAGGSQLALGIIEEKFWLAFCEIVGKPHWTSAQWPEGREAREQLDEAAVMFSARDADQWERVLREAEIPATRVRTIREAINEPHVIARSLVGHVEHPLEGRIPQFSFPLKMSSPVREMSAPPTLGQHTREILDEFGYADDAQERLLQEGVVFERH